MSSTSRTETVERYNRAYRSLAELAEMDAEEAWYPRHKVIQRHHGLVMEEMARARDRYLEMLTPVAISRCPISGDMLGRRIDLDGLDGPWWDHENPARPADEQPPTAVALSGAVLIGPAVAQAPFLAAPGPEVPFVAAGLLGLDGVVAVISSFGLGGQTAYAIAYYASTLPDDAPRPNEWGAASYPLPDGGWGADAIFETDYDYELGPWIDAAKLQWIAPGDTTLTVRAGRGGCAYLELPGRRSVTRLRDGEVWWPESSPNESVATREERSS